MTVNKGVPPKEVQDKQFKEWLKLQTFSNVDNDKVRNAIIDELKFLSVMDVKEYTLYRKWLEIQQKYPAKESNVGVFFSNSKASHYPKLLEMKDDIWIPKTPDDYMKLKPKMLLTDGGKSTKLWNTLRIFIHTQNNNTNIGRNMMFVVIDEVTEKYLGLICMTGDFLDLTPRDKYIGWTREQRTQGGRLNHTCIGSTIVPTQPLGYNYLGGKLMALMAISNTVEEEWKKKYGYTIAGVTTTSLYSSFSQYQNLQYWNKRGHSSGSIRFEPTRSTIKLAKEWLRYTEPRKYWEWSVALRYSNLPLKRDAKQRLLAYVYRLLKVPKELTMTDHKRGIYFCTLFNNTCEFLRDEIGEDKLVKRFDNSTEALVNIWKERYAKKRVNKLLADGRYNTDTLFYDGMIGKTWEESREIYLGEVGR